MIPYNVLLFEFNKNSPIVYNIMPYLISVYKKQYKKEKLRISNFKSIKEFLLKELQYQYWGRCEYEFIMVHWPYREINPLENSYKIDVYEQCKINIDVITKIFIENIKFI